MIQMRRLPRARNRQVGWLAIAGEVAILVLAAANLVWGPLAQHVVLSRGAFIGALVVIGLLGFVAEANLTRYDSLRAAFGYVAGFVAAVIAAGLLYALANTYAFASLGNLFADHMLEALLLIAGWLLLMRSVARHLPLWSLVALGLPLLFIGIEPAGGVILVVAYTGYLWYLRREIQRLSLSAPFSSQ
ncbi:MAG: hypothetical protein ACXWQZ_04765 [Ktedonobacterales bacterium]